MNKIFDAKLGPTSQCLSSREIVNIIENNLTDPEHIKSCEICKAIFERSKKLLKETN